MSVRLVFCNHLHLTSRYSNFYIRNLPGSSKLIYHCEISNLFTKLSQQGLFASISNFTQHLSKLIISIILTQKQEYACVYHNGVYVQYFTHMVTQCINLSIWHLNDVTNDRKKCGLFSLYLHCSTFICINFQHHLTYWNWAAPCKRGESEEIEECR